jgi:hypothetical protein
MFFITKGVSPLINDDISNGIDELDALDVDSHEAMMNNTTAVYEMVKNIHIILSTCNVSLIHI